MKTNEFKRATATATELWQKVKQVCEQSESDYYQNVYHVGDELYGKVLKDDSVELECHCRTHDILLAVLPAEMSQLEMNASIPLAKAALWVARRASDYKGWGLGGPLWSGLVCSRNPEVPGGWQVSYRVAYVWQGSYEPEWDRPWLDIHPLGEELQEKCLQSYHVGYIHK